MNAVPFVLDAILSGLDILGHSRDHGHMLIGIFNNKGGVGKTTYMYHLAHVIARQGEAVLMVDCDPQCNLTAYALEDDIIERCWDQDRGNSIFLAVQPLHEGLGDVRDRKPTALGPKYPTLWLVPGDPKLSEFEDTLGDAWNRAKGGNAADVRKQSGLFRFILSAAAKVNASYIFLDLGPNLGATNRTLLSSCDYFIVPVAPDLFSIRGTENLGKRLVTWRNEWQQIRQAAPDGIALPAATPKFAGYVTQQHNQRSNSAGMTKGWQLFGNRLEQAIVDNIVRRLEPLGQVVRWDDGNYNLGAIPNLHSLVPYSQDARKPIFDCGSAEGLTGAHIYAARDSIHLFEPMANALRNLAGASR